MGTKSLWGDWLPKIVAALDAVEPTPEEKEILRRAHQIKEAHKRRIETVIAASGGNFKFAR